MILIISLAVLVGAFIVVQYFRLQKQRPSRPRPPIQPQVAARIEPPVVRRRWASGFGAVLVHIVRSIPFIPLLWVGVLGYFLFQIGTGIRNWMSQPTQETQVVEFRSLTTSNVVGQQQTITVGPLETWVLRTGTVTGDHKHPDGYWACASSSSSILEGVVFENRRVGYGRHEQRFTDAARLRLVQQGVTAVTITYTQQIGRPGGSSPCDQVLTR